MDFPKYLGLAGRLTDDNDELCEDLFDDITMLVSGAKYPEASTQLNEKFADVASALDEDEKLETGSELYVRLRDVAPLIQAVRKLRNACAVSTELSDDVVIGAMDALAKLVDIPDNALS